MASCCEMGEADRARVSWCSAVYLAAGVLATHLQGGARGGRRTPRGQGRGPRWGERLAARRRRYRQLSSRRRARPFPDLSPGPVTEPARRQLPAWRVAPPGRGQAAQQADAGGARGRLEGDVDEGGPDLAGGRAGRRAASARISARVPSAARAAGLCGAGAWAACSRLFGGHLSNAAGENRRGAQAACWSPSSLSAPRRCGPASLPRRRRDRAEIAQREIGSREHDETGSMRQNDRTPLAVAADPCP